MTGDRKTPTELYNGYKDGNYEAKRIVLTSPMLHIGGEVSQLNPFEYIKDGSNVYLPHRDALAKALLQKGRHFLENDYLAAIKKNKSIYTLLKQAFGEEWYNMQSAAGVDVFPDRRPIWTQDREDGEMKKLRPMIRNGMGQLYIPGSSIKGAIRTAIAYYLLKHGDRYKVPSSSRVSKIEEKLREKIKRRVLENNNTMQKKLDDDLFMNKLFSHYDLRDKNRTGLKSYKDANIQNTDILRAIKVSDSQPLRRTKVKGKEKLYNNPVVAEAIVSSHYRDGRAKYRASIYGEMVENVRGEFTLTLDKDMLKWFSHRQGMKIPFNTVDELMNICQEFARVQWQYEFNYWDKIFNNKDRNIDLYFDFVYDFYKKYKENCPYNLRVGWGSGMTGTTIDWLLEYETRSQLRDACSKYNKAPGFEAPKSRRTIVDSNGEIRYVPGWVKFKVLS